VVKICLSHWQPPVSDKNDNFQSMERLIYFFYIFFQGTLFLQAAIFLTLSISSRKKELQYYSLFLLLIGFNFFISAPTTFGFGDDETVLNSGWYKLINTPLVIGGNLFYVLFLREFYRSLTHSRPFFFILNVTKWALMVALLLFLSLYAFGIHSNLLFNILNLIGIVSGIWLVTIIIGERLPFTQLMAYGFIINLIGTLLTVAMLIMLTQGVKHWLVTGYPLVFVKLGLLGEIFFFTLAIFKKWQQQEKELSVQQLKTELAVEKIKSQISKELHDDIGSTLSGINMYSHLANQQQLTGQEKESQASIHIIQQASDEMIERLKDIVWVMQPGHNTLEQLLNKIKEFAAFITGAKKITLLADFTKATPNIKISTEVRHHIYTITKEILNNAVKYSNTPDITITAITESNHFMLQIKDNGRGFDTNQKTDGNGLINIRSRALEMGGKLELQSTLGKGTIMTLTLKITQRGIA
jgi:signal transduction histidine kinase